MYKFKKMKNEEIILIEDDCALIYEDNKRNISVILTNMRLILLDYLTNGYEEDLRLSRGVQYLKEKEELRSFNLNEISEIVKGDFDKYILNNSNFFYLKTKDIKNKLDL